MSEQRRKSDNTLDGEEDPPLISAAPSILRNVTASRQLLAEAASIVISLPDEDRPSSPDETPEQRHRRRIRFLEMRREHYSQMHQHTEQCTMSDDDQQELPNTNPPGMEDKK
ncbi:uncharacterized protein [Drosophila kikkawai]|uniref:Uncharacterized protein n=1 Tax=Drosophila kikkawai TaxID=30033 RepID=A0A6P4JCN7_DROKI|nr:uncharacterized protein LOC108082044 [Drosophila kikkawai]